MPDVKVRVPLNLFWRCKDVNHIQIRSDFVTHLAWVTAAELRCVDYESKDVNLAPTDIDVHIISYPPHDVYIHGAPVLVEISAYNYPSRMDNIQDRLAAIQRAATSFLTERAHVKHDGKLVSVAYVPIPDGCWV